MPSTKRNFLFHWHMFRLQQAISQPHKLPTFFRELFKNWLNFHEFSDVSQQKARDFLPPLWLLGLQARERLTKVHPEGHPFGYVCGLDAFPFLECKFGAFPCLEKMSCCVNGRAISKH